MSDFRVVICGGGIAAVEGLLRVRRLLGASVSVELIAPAEELIYRPLAVAEPFAFGPAARYPLRRIAEDSDARWRQDSLDWVEPDARAVHTRSGARVEYDALLIAVGGRQVSPYEHATTFRDAEADASYRGVVQDVESGSTRSVAFIMPVGPVWPLPLYELALMTAARGWSAGIEDLELSIVTPEVQPLAIFGPAASDAVKKQLDRAQITVYTSALAQVPAAGQVLVQPQGIELAPGRTIALPRVKGPDIRGIAGGGAHGFVPIDAYCRVPRTDGRVFAAGDAVSYPIKHGSLGAQMADTAATSIAALAGLPVKPEKFRPVIQGKLLTGADPLFISARLIGPEGFQSEVYFVPPWPDADKVVAEELGPYLAAFGEADDADRAESIG